MSVARALTTSPLGDFFWFQEGPGVRNWQFKDSGVKLLNVANIEKGGGLNLEKSSRYLSVDEVETRYSHFLIDAGDLVIASSGISFDVDGMLRTRGAFVDESHLPLCLNTSTIRFKAKAGISDLGYLKYWLDSLEFREEITKRVTGSAQQNFGPSHLKAMQISLPPLPEQRRIAAILDQADALRAKRREALAQLDSLTQSIFIEMFGDPVTNPKNWVVKPLIECAERIQIGPFGTQLHEEDYIDGGIPLINPVHLRGGMIRPDSSLTVSPEKYTELCNYYLVSGDLIMGRRGEMGRCAVITQREQGWLCGTGSLFVRPKTDVIHPVYLGLVISSPSMRRFLENVAQGVTMANLNKTIVGELPIAVPPMAKQLAFVSQLNGTQAVKKHSLDSLAELDTLFASLQHRAFRGEL